MNKVTITGADDNTPIQALIDLSAEFPFVEWGILVSKKQEGGFRFPGETWMTRFTKEAIENKVSVSMHVCGSWVRSILKGSLNWGELPPVRVAATRVQLNTHAEEHIATLAAFDWIREHHEHTFIFQLDGVNDHLLSAAVGLSIRNVSGLFDCSHGAGILPDSWPSPVHWNVSYGFAGGLGPDNVIEQVPKIKNAFGPVGDINCWIDMEGKVRDEREHLDLGKVRRVLELCAFAVN